MRIYPRKFSVNRRRLPERRAERRVYEALAGSNCEGFVYYEWRRDRRHIELDFALWMEPWGRVALQVKGGAYLLEDGEWCLRTRHGLRQVYSSPLDEAWLAALDLHDAIKELDQTTYRPFVIPVVGFPDMADPDSDIEQLARRKKVHLIWGVENLMADLEEILRSRGMCHGLSADRIGHEVFAVTDGLICLDRTQVNRGGVGTGRVEDAAEIGGCPAVGRNAIRLRLSLCGVEIARVTIGEVHITAGDADGDGS